MALVDCKQMEGLASAIKEQIAAHKDVIADYNPLWFEYISYWF